MLGCGSLGAPIALKFGAAGVGSFVLVDPQALTGPNTSRHELGSAWVGKNKAAALRAVLLRKYPHLSSVSHYAETWQEALARNENLFNDVDLVVMATGNWHAEAQFNDWHLSHRRAPLALYAWVEPEPQRVMRSRSVQWGAAFSAASMRAAARGCQSQSGRTS